LLIFSLALTVLYFFTLLPSLIPKVTLILDLALINDGAYDPKVSLP